MAYRYLLQSRTYLNDEWWTKVLIIIAERKSIVEKNPYVLSASHETIQNCEDISTKKRPPECPLLRFCNVNIFENQYYFKWMSYLQQMDTTGNHYVKSNMLDRVRHYHMISLTDEMENLSSEIIREE